MITPSGFPAQTCSQLVYPDSLCTPSSPNHPVASSAPFPPPYGGVPLPSTPFPGTAGSPGAGCRWLRRARKAQQPQHPTPAHRKTWQHRWHISILSPSHPGQKLLVAVTLPASGDLSTISGALRARPAPERDGERLYSPLRGWGSPALSHGTAWPLSAAGCDRDTRHGAELGEALAYLSPG